MEPVRCHISMIFEKALTLLRQLIPTILVLGISLRGLHILWLSGAILLLLLLAGLYLVLLWRNTWVYTDQNQLVTISGVLWKTQTAIPFDKINTVDLSRNVIQRILGTCRVKIDTGVVKEAKKGSEVDLVFSVEQAREIRKQILSLAADARSENSDSKNETNLNNEKHLYDDQTVQDNKTVYQHSEVDKLTYGKNVSSFLGVDELEADQSLTGEAPQSVKAEYIAKLNDLLVFSLTRNKLAAGILAIISIFFFIEQLAGSLISAPIVDFFEKSWENVSRQNLFFIIMFVIALIILYFILSNIISMVMTVIKYYHFRVRRSSDTIYIRYGLFTEKNFSLPIHNVHAIIIKQNMLRQVFNRASIEIESIGYGDDDKEISLLFPLIKIKNIDKELAAILPEYAGKTDLQKAPVRAMRRFFIVPTLSTIILIAIPSLIFLKQALLLLIPALLFVWISSYLSYRNAAIGYNNDILEIRNGSFHKILYRISMDAVQNIGTYSHPLIERDSLANFKIDYHAAVLKSSVVVRFLDDRHLPMIRNLLEKS